MTLYDKKPKSRFLKVICPRCKKSQIVFGKSATQIKCANCNYLLLKPKGGKSKIRAKIKEII
ncbi:30S ribosomal protein S27e [Candidatus Pacearchaeota archaeon]|nr:30S ribosomal protein S27e [Candidatus Pacearchaeota archaeon]